MIWGAPAISDLDNDGDLEIIFTTENTNNGDLYAIHHNGELVEGFPANIDEKMMVGPSVGDLEGDGLMDIVVVTWSKNIIALDAHGIIKSGFPFLSSKRFNSPATLVDLDGNGTLEIIAGNDNGELHVLYYDGTEMIFFDSGDRPKPVCKTIPVPLITRFNLKDVSKSILFLARLMVSSLTFEVIFPESISFLIAFNVFLNSFLIIFLG